MKIKTLFNKVLWVCIALFLSLFCVLENIFMNVVNAEEVQVKSYDETSILDDLSDVNALDYASKDVVEAVRFQEYCYSQKPFLSDYYGLYLYVFNPTGTLFVETEDNLVNMAVAYDEKSGEPIEYANLKLTYLDKTDNGRFYKFKVSDSDNFYSLATAYEEKFGKRRYDVVGFEFLQKNGSLVITKQEDVAISKTYYYTGYSAGCAAEASVDDKTSTLTCEVKVLETVNLEVKHTNRLMENYGLTEHGDDNICDNLHTAYFSVPEKYFTEYGNLQKISAEWYEYKTAPIFVTSDEGAFDAFQEYLGKNIGTTIDELKWRVIWDFTSIDTLGGTAYEYFWRYNSENLHNVDWSESFVYGDDVQNVPRMSWLFYKDADVSREGYRVSSDELLEYAKAYKENQLDGVPLVRDKYSYDLFSTFGSSENGFELNSIDEDRQTLLEDQTKKYGYVKVNADASETENLLDTSDMSFWENFFAIKNDETNVTANRIEVLNNAVSINEKTAEVFAEEYLVGTQEAETVQDYCVEQIGNGNRVVLFRFAKTDYYAANARFDDYTTNNMSSEDGFVSQQTVFLDFNIISLTFRSETKGDTVIGIVSNPVDMFSSIEPSNDMNEDGDWKKYLKWILLGICAIFIVSIFGFVFAPMLRLLGKGIGVIFKALWFLITLPFKLIGMLFHRNE